MPFRKTVRRVLYPSIDLAIVRIGEWLLRPPTARTSRTGKQVAQ